MKQYIDFFSGRYLENWIMKCLILSHQSQYYVQFCKITNQISPYFCVDQTKFISTGWILAKKIINSLETAASNHNFFTSAQWCKIILEHIWPQWINYDLKWPLLRKKVAVACILHRHFWQKNVVSLFLQHCDIAILNKFRQHLAF